MTLQAFFKYFFAYFRELFLWRRKKSLLNKELKEEISRFARDDSTTSLRDDFVRGLLFQLRGWEITPSKLPQEK